MMKITPKQYAKIRGITHQAVIKQIKHGRALPGVESIERYERFFVLNFNKKTLDSWQKQRFKNKSADS